MLFVSHGRQKHPFWQLKFQECSQNDRGKRDHKEQEHAKIATTLQREDGLSKLVSIVYVYLV